VSPPRDRLCPVVGVAALLLALAAVVAAPAPARAAPPKENAPDLKGKAETYVQAAAAAREAGDHAAAVAYLEKAVEAAPADPVVRAGLAEAVAARARSHGKSDALAAAGQAALQAGEFDKAIAYFEKALEGWSDNARARTGLTTAISKQRESTKRHAVQLARLYAGRGQSDKARDEYLKALAAEPGDPTIERELTAHVGSWPWPWVRAILQSAKTTLMELLPWLAIAAGVFLAIVVVVNLCRSFAAPTSVEVLPFNGPDDFEKRTGAAMAALVSSQLHAAGLALGLGAVAEPLTSVIGKISDAPVQVLGQLVAWLFPPRGFRLQAVVFELPNSRQTQVTAKLVRLTFRAPRETVVATITFRQATQGAVHETLARLTAAWTEWHVAVSRAEYGTNDERAFAYFVAGLFAERVGHLDVASALYTAAMQLDAQYHKALNNRGRRTLAEGASAYIRHEDATARRLFEDAAGLFSRAKVLASVPEYHYNLGTALSYLGRVKLREGDRPQAVVKQYESMVAYDEALTSLAQEPVRTDPAERQAFKASIQLMRATSSVLHRELAGAPAAEAAAQMQQEQAIVEEATSIFASQSIVSQPRLEYNLACYHAVANHLEEAIPIFRTLRAIYPGISRTVLTDPDLADIPAVRALFSDGAPANPPVPAPPVPVGVAWTKPDDDPDREEPT
jgi:tetratricopeptide (TPR) repeat protein